MAFFRTKALATFLLGAIFVLASLVFVFLITVHAYPETASGVLSMAVAFGTGLILLALSVPSFVSSDENSLVVEGDTTRYPETLDVLSPLAILTLDGEGRITSINKGAEALLGVSSAEVLAQYLETFFPNTKDGGINLRLLMHQARVLGTITEVTKHNKGVGENLSRMWIASTLSPLTSPRNGEKTSGFLLVLEDKTNAKLFEDRLRENEERLRSVVDTVLDGIITINDQGIIQSANPASARIFGREENAMIGRNVNTLMPEPYRSGHDGYLLNFLTTNQKKIIGIGREVSGQKADGTVFPMELQVAEFQQKGKRYFTGIVRDITDRRRLDEWSNAEHLRQRESLEKEVQDRTKELALANQSLNATIVELRESREELRKLSAKLHDVLEQERSKIARDIHDELGQLLAVIKIGLGRLKKAKPSSEFSEELLAELSSSVDQTVLKMRELSSDLKPVILEQLGLPAAVEWLLKNIEKRTGIRCQLTVKGTFQDLKQEKATGLFRVLQEALTNAIKHSGSAHIDVCLIAGERAIELDVKDHGIGIAHSSERRQDSMGLLSMRERIFALGGQITFESPEDGGTTVSVHVPR